MGDAKSIALVAASTKDNASGEYVSWTAQDERALRLKIDLRIFPALVILFILNFLDRNNFANARLKGLEQDLGLSDVQYQTCISILLVGYVVMQVPSNMLLDKLSKPAWYLCGCAATWGIISAATGAVHNPSGAIACRFFLGCVEAVLFPGSLYFLSRWYTRKEMQLRVTILNAGNLLAQAFGGLIAAGVLGNMEGKAGIRAWRWLFIIEGAITIAVSAITAFVLPDYPSTTSWLSEREKLIALKRLELDIGGNDFGFSEESSQGGALHGFKDAISDIKVWILALTYFSTIMGLSFSFFFPTITASLGYGTTETLLFTAPPWIFGLLVSLPNAWHADRTGERFFHYFGPVLSCIVGYIIAMTTTATAPRYISLFLMTVGYAAGFVILAWISNTIPGPPAKRAAAIGLINACGNIGSIPGSYIYPAEYGPYYVQSFGAELAILVFASCCAFVLRTHLKSLNKKIGEEQNVDSREGLFKYLY